MSHPFLYPSPRVLAHRGDSLHCPENTLESFQSALVAGADCIETDVHLSADGEVVVIHDSRVDRVTGESGSVDKMSLKKLKQLDFGYHFSPDGGKTFPYRGKGITLPTLSEALEAFPGVKFNVDMKQKGRPMAEALAEILTRHDAIDRVMCASVHDGNLRILRALLPEAATSCGAAEAAGIILMAKAGVLFTRNSLPALALQVPSRYKGVTFINSRLIRQYHQAGLFVHAWVINNAQEMHQLLEYGTDGICTDQTALLQSLL